MSLLLLCGFSMTAFAEEAIITATVPDSHNITVTADGAEVFCNGQSGERFTVDRLSTPKLLIRAVSGKEVTKILLNGDNITEQAKGGYYTLEPIYENKALIVVTKDAPAAQGKTYTVQGTVKRNGNPVSGITIELRSTLKTNVTDSNGKVSFSNVECGQHSLTAVENGTIIGYVEFVMTEGNASDLSLADRIYTVNVNKNEIGINLTLNLTDNGIISIADVTDVSGGGSFGNTGSSSGSQAGYINSSSGSQAGNTSRPSAPQTEDSANLTLWMGLTIFTGVGLIVILGYKKIKKKSNMMNQRSILLYLHDGR